MHLGPPPPPPTPRPIPTLSAEEKVVAVVITSTASTVIVILISLTLAIMMIMRVFEPIRVIQMNMEVSLLMAHLLLLIPQTQLAEEKQVSKLIPHEVAFVITSTASTVIVSLISLPLLAIMMTMRVFDPI